MKRRDDVRWVIRPALGWRIEEGMSRFLIAEGSGYSMALGRELFHQLKWNKPKRRDRPKKRR